MSNSIRIILVIGSILFLLYLLRDLRKFKISIDMSVIWIIISCLIVIMALFPKPFIYIMNFVGIESAVNGILIFFVFLLLLLVFSLFKTVSKLEFKLIELVQKIAIDEHRTKEKNEDFNNNVRI